MCFGRSRFIWWARGSLAAADVEDGVIGSEVLLQHGRDVRERPEPLVVVLPLKPPVDPAPC